MGWVTIARPGAFAGPCEGRCAHTDCASTRQHAEGECAICGKPIGYDAPHYSRQGGGLAHAICVWAEERERRNVAAS